MLRFRYAEEAFGFSIIILKRAIFCLCIFISSPIQWGRCACFELKFLFVNSYVAYIGRKIRSKWRNKIQVYIWWLALELRMNIIPRRSTTTTTKKKRQVSIHRRFDIEMVSTYTNNDDRFYCSIQKERNRNGITIQTPYNATMGAGRLRWIFFHFMCVYLLGRISRWVNNIKYQVKQKHTLQKLDTEQTDRTEILRRIRIRYIIAIATAIKINYAMRTLRHHTYCCISLRAVDYSFIPYDV